MFEETNTSFFEYLKDRTVSPLFGAFAISWSVWNYKCILALLAYIPLKDKISFIETELYPEFLLGSVHLFFGPLLTALTFLFLYPWPAKKVFQFWRLKQKELRDIKLEIDNESLLTLEESKRIRKRIIEMQTDYEEQLKNNAEEIESLKESLISANREIEETHAHFNEAMSAGYTDETDQRKVLDSVILNVIQKQPYRLVFNPKKGKQGSKIMLFGPDGTIIEGNNDNESKWRVVNGRLELIQSDGLVHSRFNYDIPTNVFTHTNDSDTKSTKGQYIAPEPDAA